MWTRPRPDYARCEGPPRLGGISSANSIRLRAAFGVNARAQILAALLDASPGGLNAAGLARATRFTNPSVASALDVLLSQPWTTGRSARLALRPAPGASILSEAKRKTSTGQCADPGRTSHPNSIDAGLQ